MLHSSYGVGLAFAGVRMGAYSRLRSLELCGFCLVRMHVHCTFALQYRDKIEIYSCPRGPPKDGSASCIIPA